MVAAKAVEVEVWNLISVDIISPGDFTELDPLSCISIFIKPTVRTATKTTTTKRAGKGRTSVNGKTGHNASKWIGAIEFAAMRV